MSQLILSPTSTSIYATLSGLAVSQSVRVLQFFKNSVTGTPSSETLIPASSVEAEYHYTYSGLKTNVEYTIIVRIIDYETDEVLEEYIEKATCGGSTKAPAFTVTDITTNSATVELYRGSPSHNYYRLYVFDTEDEVAIFTDWLKPDSYPKQLTGLSDGTTYRINVGYGEIYGAGVTWIGTQTFTTTVEFDTGHSDTGSFTMPDSAIDRNIIQSRASSLKKSTFNDNFTRVTITTKDTESNSDIAYSVGNDNGLELTVSCPWIGANEHDAIKIATYILSTVNTYNYAPYDASEALIDPAAELGDLISFDTVTSEIINLDINYDLLFNADVSAPTSNETAHEFPQGATSKDATKRYVDGVRAALEVEMDKITAMVENNAGRFQKLQVTLDGVIIQNENGQTVINGGHIQSNTIELTNQNYNGTRFDTKINEMDLATSAASRAAGAAQQTANAAQQTATSKITSTEAASIASTKIIEDLNNTYGIKSEDSHSVLTSAYIYSPNLVAGDVHDASATINHLGVLFGTYNDTTKMVTANYARLGYENANRVIEGVSTEVKLPILTLGQGGATPEDGSGVVKKYYNGIWVGEYFNDSTHSDFSPSRANAAGLFFKTSNNTLVLPPSMYGSASSSMPSNPMVGTVYFVEAT